MLIDFSAWGVPELSDPHQFSQSDAGTVQRVLLGLASAMSIAANEVADQSERRLERKAQADFDNLKSISMVLMSVSRTEREIAR